MKHHSRKLASLIKTRVAEMPPRMVAAVARCALSQCTPAMARAMSSQRSASAGPTNQKKDRP
jgi:hypothetical protein